MNVQRLRRLFSHALTVSLAPSLVITGCQQEPAKEPSKGPSKVPEVSSKVDCGKHGPEFDKLSITPAPDFIELHSFTTAFSEPGEPRSEATHGEACKTASDAPGCRLALGRLKSTEGFGKGLAHYYLTSTRGDVVSAYSTREQLITFLGTIDAPQEAALVAFASGYQICKDGDARGRVGANPAGGFTVIGEKGNGCNSDVTRHTLNVSASGQVTEVESQLIQERRAGCSVGRRPAGLQDAEGGACEDARGRYFADVAHLEAASIHAFLRLREELALHGAGAELLDAALASAADEVRHTDVTSRLARRFGATPPPPSVEDLPLRPLSDVLLDNAVEGCVRETYGALVAHHQALHARDPEIREAMLRIAEDETRHAGLSWDVADWARPRLSAQERTALREAQRHAVEVLRAEVAVPLDARLTADAGLPSPEVARALLDSLEQELWA
ncbi:ferritin-like domain-containing protein [Corallococcus sp. CA053C]|uniref:ferritin-like domain-containing protein n=1 Tax=Corallococcus sp. CA053C TaxID=2316732 RepID=UPI000EA2A33E|nr:ferritin-like domain-containing protein [Corallococcus sp. CA053C]RKH07007.1 ferritin-like domain-containing protein [Corallococcus sp. CA053C]